MKIPALVSSSYFLTLVFFFGNLEEILTCDTKWIRLVYMMSCGKKKRESVFNHNDTFLEDLPPDFEGAFKYFKDRDPLNPVFRNNALLTQILQEDEPTSNVKSYNPKLLLSDSEKEHKEAETPITQRSSVFFGKLIPKTSLNNHIGIQGFPDQWDIEEIIEDKINENHRRQINKLIEECCKVPPVTTCNGNTFSGACK